MLFLKYGIFVWLYVENFVVVCYDFRELLVMLVNYDKYI